MGRLDPILRLMFLVFNPYDTGLITASLTCAELNRRVQNLAGMLLASTEKYKKGLGLKAGEMVVLVYPPSLDFIVAFLACLRAGLVAVPVYPPDPRKMNKDVHMFVAVTQNCYAKTALTCSSYYNMKKILALKEKITFSSAAPWPEQLTWIVTDELGSAKGIESTKHWLTPSPGAETLAFLQYTSGSTSVPKGVMLSHGNLNHNLRTISSALQAGRDTVVVSWLPQYHDMGLIGAYLGTIFNGGTGVYLSPYSFIRDPCLWLRLVSKHRATHLQAPNFAYSLLARKSDQLIAGNEGGASRIDLSCVRHMINGAEPIQGEVMDRFYHVFSPFGLSKDVIKPTYGLAEHTVYVCGGGKQRVVVDRQVLETAGVVQVLEKSTGTVETKELVGCGVPSRKDYGIDVRIVDASTGEEKGEGQVGEIWITSASKAQGYYGDELAHVSTEVFEATIAGDPKGKRFLKTGDLGVFYHDELFICGRKKDVVIIRGRNHYPQDLEATAESHEDLRPGCCAAFSYVTGPEDEEKLAIVAELRDPAMTQKASLCGKIRSAIARDHGVKVTFVVLLAPRSIPKTTSGKISRSRCKKAFQDKTLEEIYRNEDMIAEVREQDEEAVEEEGRRNPSVDKKHSSHDQQSKLPSIVTDVPPDQVYTFLVTELAHVLGQEPSDIDKETPLQDLGLDSMALTQLQGVIGQKYHVQVEEQVLYDASTTLASLHAALCGHTLDRKGASTCSTPKKATLCCGWITC